MVHVTKAASAKDDIKSWLKFKMLKLVAWCLVKMTQNNNFVEHYVPIEVVLV